MSLPYVLQAFLGSLRFGYTDIFQQRWILGSWKSIGIVFSEMSDDGAMGEY